MAPNSPIWFQYGLNAKGVRGQGHEIGSEVLVTPKQKHNRAPGQMKYRLCPGAKKAAQMISNLHILSCELLVGF